MIKFESTIKKIQKSISGFQRMHPWHSGILTYVGIFAAVDIFFNFFIIQHLPTSLEVNNARYFLSALVQCQAAIIALVTTLTIVAVQTTASSYGSRVIPTFKNKPDLWLLLTIYTFAIILGFFLLIILDKGITDSGTVGTLQFLNPEVSNFIFFDFLFGIFTFVALFPYLLNILDLLKIKTIMENLAAKITKNDYLISDQENNFFEALLNLIHLSIKNNDSSMTIFGLNCLSKKFNDIWPNKCSDDDNETVAINYRSELLRCGEIAADRRDDRIFLEIVYSLNRFQDLVFKKEDDHFTNITYNAINGTGILGRIAAEKKMEFPLRMCVYRLGEIGHFLVEKEEPHYLSLIINTLIDLSESSIENKQSWPTETIVDVFDRLNKIMINKPKFQSFVYQNVHSLKSIGILSIENNWQSVSDPVIKSIVSSGKNFIERNNLASFSIVLNSLAELGSKACQKRDKHSVDLIIDSLSEIGVIAYNLERDYKSQWDNQSDDSIISSQPIDESEGSLISKVFCAIAEECAKNQWDSDETWDIIDRNYKLWQKAIEKKDIFGKPQIIRTINKIGVISARNKFDCSTSYAIKTLFNIFHQAYSEQDKSSYLDAIRALGEIASSAAENELSNPTKLALTNLCNIIEIVPSSQLVEPLLKMGITFTSNKSSSGINRVSALLKILLQNDHDSTIEEIKIFKKQMMGKKETELISLLEISGIIPE